MFQEVPAKRTGVPPEPLRGCPRPRCPGAQPAAPTRASRRRRTKGRWRAPGRGGRTAPLAAPRLCAPCSAPCSTSPRSFPPGRGPGAPAARGALTLLVTRVSSGLICSPVPSASMVAGRPGSAAADGSEARSAPPLAAAAAAGDPGARDQTNVRPCSSGAHPTRARLGGKRAEAPERTGYGRGARVCARPGGASGRRRRVRSEAAAWSVQPGVSEPGAARREVARAA